MEMYTKENSEKTKQTEKGLTSIVLALSILVVGEMIKRMDSVEKIGMMGLTMKVISRVD